MLVHEPRLIRPANYPEGTPGRGVHVGETAAGVRVATINLEGQVFMKNLDSPFRVADRLLADLDKQVKVVFVDFHAEATSEKQALGIYLDGRVSGVVGTHTHVPTADERVLPKGTAFQSDAGMCGQEESVIGSQVGPVLESYHTMMPTRFGVGKGTVRINGVIVDVDTATGKALHIERVVRYWDPA